MLFSYCRVAWKKIYSEIIWSRCRPPSPAPLLQRSHQTHSCAYPSQRKWRKTVRISFVQKKGTSLLSSSPTPPSIIGIGPSKLSEPDIVEMDGPDPLGGQFVQDHQPNFIKPASPVVSGILNCVIIQFYGKYMCIYIALVFFFFFSWQSMMPSAWRHHKKRFLSCGQTELWDFVLCRWWRWEPEEVQQKRWVLCSRTSPRSYEIFPNLLLSFLLVAKNGGRCTPAVIWLLAQSNASLGGLTLLHSQPYFDSSNILGIHFIKKWGNIWLKLASLLGHAPKRNLTAPVFRSGPIRHKFLRLLLPFWSNALPTLPVTAPPRKDGSAAADDLPEGRSRHQRSSRMDPRKILLTIAIMSALTTTNPAFLSSLSRQTKKNYQNDQNCPYSDLDSSDFIFSCF